MTETFSFQAASTDQGKRLDFWLHEQAPEYSRSRLKNLIDGHHVQINGKQGTPSQKMKEGDTVVLHIPPANDPIPQATTIPLDIIYEDTDLLVLNKAAGLVVHPACGHWQDTLVNGLLAYCGETLSGIGGVKRPGIVHRLDKGTSGLMVVAKNDKAHQGLSAQFSDRSLSRSYQALVWGIMTPLSGRVHTLLGRSPSHRQKMAVVPKGGKEAITDYQSLKTLSSHVSLITCTLQTGRTHQIRVHMSHLGHGLIGDPLYGHSPKGVSGDLKTLADSFKTQERPLLHAYHIHFIHPCTSQALEFNIPMHNDFKKIMDFF